MYENELKEDIQSEKNFSEYEQFLSVCSEPLARDLFARNMHDAHARTVAEVGIIVKFVVMAHASFN